MAGTIDAWTPQEPQWKTYQYGRVKVFGTLQYYYKCVQSNRFSILRVLTTYGIDDFEYTATHYDLSTAHFDYDLYLAIVINTVNIFPPRSWPPFISNVQWRELSPVLKFLFLDRFQKYILTNTSLLQEQETLPGAFQEEFYSQSQQDFKRQLQERLGLTITIDIHNVIEHAMKSNPAALELAPYLNLNEFIYYAGEDAFPRPKFVPHESDFQYENEALVITTLLKAPGGVLPVEVVEREIREAKNHDERYDVKTIDTLVEAGYLSRDNPRGHVKLVAMIGDHISKYYHQ